MRTKSIIIILLALMFSALKAEEVRTVHVFVALCDNLNQGIVPVPEFMGNGKDTRQNLYWGLAGGVKHILKIVKSGAWLKPRRIPPRRSWKEFYLNIKVLMFIFWLMLMMELRLNRQLPTF